MQLMKLNYNITNGLGKNLWAYTNDDACYNISLNNNYAIGLKVNKDLANNSITRISTKCKTKKDRF
jgi:hypothetical protein